ncbi:hypothetical protein SteCoe_35030 [Stentor coeruleus]|uniref:Cyclic nucleotide-binding domain-containing protein n=1 Tax=Stentor coeruleus TaxID=5963 RepID=A0A1R2AT93_9CILI|nr:hypothetical protein SteCoe_35030 [Stentor coeruleus]
MDSLLSLFSMKVMKSRALSKPDYSLPTLIRYLKIPPSQRKSREINMIKVFSSKVPFFIDNHSENSESIHYQCCQSMKYEYFSNGETVFKFGDIGKYFYIILDGEVNEQVPNNLVNNLEYTSVTLGPGCAFGDSVLLKEHQRDSTVVCLSECHMACLDKNDYTSILGKITDKKISDFVDFLKEIPIFRSWSKKNLEDLFYVFKTMSFNRKNLVYSLGSEPTNVYIVKSGEFEISKKVVLATENQKIDMKVAILTKGEMFGDSEVLEEIPREFNCTCYSTTGELYAITAKDFMLKVKTEESIGLINIKNKTKSELRHQRSKAFEEIFTPRRQRFRSNTKNEKESKPVKNVLPLLIRDKIQNRKTERIELSKLDFEAIKARALPEKSGRVFIAMNTPVDFSYRSPSPQKRSKSTVLSIKKSKRVNLFSLLG